MSTAAKITLLFVVFVDLIGQGLVFPIINGMIMEPDAGFLPSDTSEAVRHLDYGLVIGIFFLAWFLGVVYVSKLSDAIGRKNALLICLGGALAGYVCTILALFLNSLWLLIVGRAITGFTAGNQPIAQAAMVDGSANAADRDRNMGYIVTGISFGLVGGPIIGGILSDRSLLGSYASYEAPFYGALALVSIAIALVLTFFRDVRQERKPIVFRPAEIFENLWQVTKHPLVLRLMPAYACFMVANVTFYIFIDNYLTSAFGYGVVGGSAVMLVIGFALAFSSTFLVKPAQERFDKTSIVGVTLAVWAVAALAVSGSPIAVLCFVPVFVFYFCFGVAYPTVLGLFSGSVGEADQGWVMGITTAVFTLAGGIMSLIGGGLMDVDIRLPFYITAAAAGMGVLFVSLQWRRPAPVLAHKHESNPSSHETTSSRH
jgi:DHA1 family tetracycline resistance protein-like MFS transporter